MGEIGDALRNARESRGTSLERAAEETRIARRFLEALESEAFRELPAVVYARGFLRSYATYLGLEPEPLLARLSAEGQAGPPGAPDAFVGGAPAAHTDPFGRRQPEPPRGVVPIEDEALDEYTPGANAAPPPPPPPGPRGRGPGVVPYGTRPTPGVLTPRQRRYDDAGVPRSVALVALGLIAIVVVAFGAFCIASAGSDDDDSGIPVNPGATATDTPQQTIIPLQSPTTADGGDNGTPAPTNGTENPGETPTPAAPTPTSSGGGSEPTATPTPTETPTPSPTPQPTATPTATTVPTPVPPRQVSECTPEGNTVDCGDPPYRIVCVPGVDWFFDVPPYFAPLPSGWFEVGFFDTTGSAKLAGNNACS